MVLNLTKYVFYCIIILQKVGEYMAISRIVIKNYKSIKKCSVSVNKINTFIGENGTGKSNILSAVNYFYKNLITQNIEKDIFDKNNKFNNKIEIAITFDMRMLKNRIKHNSAVQKNPQYAGFYKHINSMQDFETLKFTQIKDGKIFWQRILGEKDNEYYKDWKRHCPPSASSNEATHTLYFRGW